MTTLACTVCASDTGALVRAGIFDAAFLDTLAAVLAPFPVLAAALLVVSRWPAGGP